MQEIADISLPDESPISRYLLGMDKSGQSRMRDCLPLTIDFIFPDHEIQEYNSPSGKTQDELTRVNVSCNHLSTFPFGLL